VKTEPVNALIIEDDRAIQRLLADVLNKMGFTVTVERDGQWALKTFERKPFDVVLLDLVLPSLDGYEVARKMRSLPKGKRTPIIMISGVYTTQLHKEDAVNKHGAFALLEKPFNLAALRTTLHAALGPKFPGGPELDEEPPPEQDAGGAHAEGDADDPHTREEIVAVETLARVPAVATQLVAGTFENRTFPELLAELYRWRATGALLLRRDRVKKVVSFRDGFVQAVKSNLLPEVLGRVMLREKMITEPEYLESLEQMKATGRQQGTLLVEMGCISPHNLGYALRLQLQRKLFEIFAWREGDYRFNPKATLPPEPVGLEMGTAQAILEGVKYAYGEKQLQRVLGGLQDLYVHPNEDPLFGLQDLSLTAEERSLLDSADGTRTVNELRAMGLVTPVQADRLLYALRCAQVLHFKQDRAATHTPSTSRLAREAAAKQPPPLPARAAPALPAAAEPQRDLSQGWDAPPGVMDTLPRESRRRMPRNVPEQSLGEEPSGPPIRRAPKSLLPDLPGPDPVGAPDTAAMQLPDDVAVRDELAAKLSELRRQDYFQVLGVAPAADKQALRRAYFALAREYHPDRHFGHASADVRQLASQVYELLSTAHDVLTDPTERERYERELAQGLRREMGDEVGRILAAEGRFQKGELLFRKGDYAGASATFREAIELYPDEGEFYAWLGWSRFHLAPQSDAARDEALAALEKATALNPRSDKAWLFTGYLYLSKGRPDKAGRQFEKALQCNPDCTEALRELRALGQKRR
jgi:CheY-like chemotaxis protein/curved DNA-binding protein CbpA